MSEAKRVVLEASQVLTCWTEGEPRSQVAIPGAGVIERGAVAIFEGCVDAVGSQDEIRSRYPTAERIDLSNKILTPGIVDSHTHAVFGRWRLDEYELRCAGSSYAEIAAGGGGINASVLDLRERSEDELVELTRPRLKSMLQHGTTTAEVKSGYGLTLEDELKMLRVIHRIAAEGWIDLIPTFLGAHAIEGRRRALVAVLGGNPVCGAERGRDSPRSSRRRSGPYRRRARSLCRPGGSPRPSRPCTRRSQETSAS